MRNLGPASIRRLVGLLVGGLLVSCTASEPKPSPTQAPALAGSLTQNRFDEGTRNLRTAVTNLGRTTVTVTSASIAWQGFEPVPAKVEPGTLVPGQTAGFVMRYGDPRCASKPTTAPRLHVEVDGVRRTVPLRVSDPGLLNRLYRRECGLARLDETTTVALRLGTHSVTALGEEYLPGEVVLRRRPGAAGGVTLVDLGGTVILEFLPRDGPGTVPAPMTPGRDRLRLPVLIGSAHRCDPHARGNTSQPFLLAVYVRLDHEPTQRVITVPTKGAQGRLLGIIERDCR